jgi:hypothetical protein
VGPSCQRRRGRAELGRLDRGEGGGVRARGAGWAGFGPAEGGSFPFSFFSDFYSFSFPFLFLFLFISFSLNQNFYK